MYSLIFIMFKVCVVQLVGRFGHGSKLFSGIRGLYAGLLPRSLWMGAGGFVFFGAFELAKSMLGSESVDRGRGGRKVGFCLIFFKIVTLPESDRRRC